MPEYLRREIGRVAARPTVGQWLARTRRRTTGHSATEVLDALDGQRGPWPDAGR